MISKMSLQKKNGYKRKKKLDWFTKRVEYLAPHIHSTKQIEQNLNIKMCIM